MVQSGTLLQGKYRIERMLGQGGMGTVYLATMPGFGGKRVAVKELTVALDDAAVRQFEQEAQIAARLRHPTLVEVIDCFSEGGASYIVMLYVDGQSLLEVLQQAPSGLPVLQVLSLAQQLCDVLGWLHSQHPPVIFRDLKPSNVMLDEHGQVRLIDFGIARALEPGTRTTTFIRGAGSPGYAPVEQFGSQSTDVRTDVYGLGATLYTLLTGAIPPLSANLASGDETLRPPRYPAVPPEVSDTIVKMMAQRKEDRHQSMAEVAAALKSSPRPPPPKRSLAPLLVMVGCALVATGLARLTVPHTSHAWVAALTVRSDTPGDVYVDGTRRGATPRRVPDLAPGLHHVEVRAAGFVTDSQDVRLRNGENVLSVTLHGVLPTVRPEPLPATLNTASTPPGAEVWINGARKGRTPCRLSLSPGTYAVAIHLEGFATQTRTIDLGAGASAEVDTPLHIDLTRYADAAAAIPPASSPDAAVWQRNQDRLMDALQHQDSDTVLSLVGDSGVWIEGLPGATGPVHMTRDEVARDLQPSGPLSICLQHGHIALGPDAVGHLQEITLTPE